ncbi:MAG TPA: ferritin family protein [Rhodospirillales bacterium]|nr:ferritin family protein [Rhodospirillales bacterium]
MTEKTRDVSGINTVELFLAHALTLENEAADGYQEIGDSMAVHNNPEVAGLFFQMAKYGRLHADEVRGLAAGLVLPHIPPWEYAWEDGESPEAPSMDKVHYMMRPAQALTLALRAERQAHGFYASVAAITTDARIREMAAQFAAEEAEHVRLLTEWIRKYPDPDHNWDFDPDPPAMPE